MRLRFLSNKGQKAGVHVGTMTQHLSSLQPGHRRFSRPRTLLPPKHEFYFKVQSGATGWGRGRGRGRAANGGYSLPSSLPPRLSLGAQSRQLAVPQPSRASRTRGAQRPGPGAGRGGRFGGRGPGGVARRGSRARLRGAKRPTRRHFARRPQLGRWRPLCARREEEGGRRRGRGEGRPPPAFQAAACVDAPGREASTSSANNAAGSDPALQSRGGGHEASLYGLAAGAFPSPSRVGASNQRPQGRSGFDLDRPLPRPRKPPWRPGPDPKLHTRASAPRSGSQTPLDSRARSAGVPFCPHFEREALTKATDARIWSSRPRSPTWPSRG